MLEAKKCAYFAISLHRLFQSTQLLHGMISLGERVAKLRELFYQGERNSDALFYRELKHLSRRAFPYQAKLFSRRFFRCVEQLGRVARVVPFVKRLDISALTTDGDSFAIVKELCERCHVFALAALMVVEEDANAAAAAVVESSRLRISHRWAEGVRGEDVARLEAIVCREFICLEKEGRKRKRKSRRR